MISGLLRVAVSGVLVSRGEKAGQGADSIINELASVAEQLVGLIFRTFVLDCATLSGAPICLREVCLSLGRCKILLLTLWSIKHPVSSDSPPFKVGEFYLLN